MEGYSVKAIKNVLLKGAFGILRRSMVAILYNLWPELGSLVAVVIKEFRNNRRKMTASNHQKQNE